MIRAVLLVTLLLRPVLGADMPAFKIHEIDQTLKVGYGLRIIDLDADGKLDIVVADAARVLWFDQAQNWKLREIIDNARAGVKPDNVCLDVADIDRDGKLDIALGADWQPNNTRTGGSLQWLRQGKTIDEWTVHPIAESIPTLHRIRFADMDNDQRPELIVAPLKGKDSTLQRSWLDVPSLLISYSLPEAPATEKWMADYLDAALHMTHNILPTDVTGAMSLLTASHEGVRLVRLQNQSPKRSAADQRNAAASEIKLAFRNGKPAFIATIEPFHGHQVVLHNAPKVSDGEPPSPTGGGERKVIDEQLKGGHGLWCADLNGDGEDDVVAGFREPTDSGVRPGINIYRVAGNGQTLRSWKYILDDGGMACEDLACADLDADGDIDIVACGRATKNVRIYWNQRINPG